MMMVARTVGLSLLAGGLGAGLGFAIFAPQYKDSVLASLLLGCAGGIVGAVAGGAREIATALRQRPPS